ncbi:tetratricopeptide repeat protein [Rhodococcus sp. NPDC057014]|uniref:tetratricopeptide repeat protein n=1 Tax=Rhodococcus sp. NPDC057014 TaxID=3346000 RepID=UPI003627E8CD
MTRKEAERRLSAFTGHRHLASGSEPALVQLACHAALPVALNPDLVHLLRVNYFLDPPAVLPYTAEASLLLSPLCTEVDQDLYVIDPDLRDLLLQRLVKEFGNGRLRDVARLLWEYGQRCAAWLSRPGLAEAQQITALNFIDSRRAQDWLTRAEEGTAGGAAADKRWFVAMRRDLEARAAAVHQVQADEGSLPSPLPALTELRDVLVSRLPSPADVVRVAQTAGLNPVAEILPLTTRWQRVLDAAYAANRMPVLFESLGEDPSVIQAMREYWIRLSPALRVEDGRFETPPPEWEVLEKHREQIERTLSAVCLLAPRKFDRRFARGVMGFLIGPRTVLMHESNNAADLDPTRRDPRPIRGVDVWLSFVNRVAHPQSVFGQPAMDDVEADAARLLRATVVRVEKVGDPGLEAITLEVEAGDESAMPTPLVVAAEPPSDLVGRKVYVMGYPSLSDTRGDPTIAQRIMRGASDVLRIQPGEIIGVDTAGAAQGTVVRHNCFTLGGNAGSPLVDLATGDVLGLHFGATYEYGPRGLKVGMATALWPLAGSLTQAANIFGTRATAVGYHQLGILAQDRGDYGEADRQYARSLAIFEELGDRAGMARGYHQLGRIAQDRGDYGEADRQYARSLAIFEELGDRPGMARGYGQLGRIAQDRGDYAEADRQYARSLAIFEELGDRAGMARGYQQLGRLAQDRGDYAEAERQYARALAIFEELGDRPGRARGYHQLGILAQRRGDYAEAERQYARSLAIKEELGDRAGMARGYHQLGRLAQDRGDYAEAERQYARSLAIFEELGDRPGTATGYGQLGRIAQDRGDYAEADRQYARSLAIFEELGDRPGRARGYQQLGRLAQDRGDYAEAERQYTRALTIFKKLGDRAGTASSWSRLGNLDAARDRPVEAVKWHIMALFAREDMGLPFERNAVALSTLRDVVGRQQFRTYAAAILDQDQIANLEELLEGFPGRT